MKFKQAVLGIVLSVCGAVIMCSSAAADVITVDLSGTMTGYQVQECLQPGSCTLQSSSLSEEFTATYVFDTSTGIVTVSPGNVESEGGTGIFSSLVGANGAAIRSFGANDSLGDDESNYIVDAPADILAADYLSLNDAYLNTVDGGEQISTSFVVNYTPLAPGLDQDFTTSDPNLGSFVYQTYDLECDGGQCFTETDYSGIIGSVAVTSVPEPFTLSLFGAGLAGAVAVRRRKPITNPATSPRVKTNLRQFLVPEV